MTRLDDEPLIRTIATLARDAAPVRPLAAPTVRTARWVGVAGLLGGVAVSALGPRPDLVAVLREPAFVVQTLLLLASVIGASATALSLAVPGAAPSVARRAAVLTLGLTWVGLLVWAVARDSHGALQGTADPEHAVCIARQAAIGLPAGVVLVAMLRASAPLDARWTAVMGATAAVALGAVGTQLVCADGAPPHLLLWHALPALAVCVAAVAFGRRVFT